MEELAVVNVTQEFSIDKQDVVTVAIARGEAKIKNKIRMLQAQIADLKKSNEAIEAEYKAIGEKEVMSRLAGKHKAAEKVVDAIRNDLGIEKTSCTIETQVYTVANSSVKLVNSGTLFIKINSDKSDVERIAFEATAKQRELSEKFSANEQQISELTAEAVSWKRKLSDMPAFERQMRAAIVEQQLEKTVAGREILESLGKNFEESIKMIGA
jgi:flagellar capping protein FliD